MKTKKTLIISLSVALAAVLLLGAAALLFYNGSLLFNDPSRKQYPVRGIDVSHYQGEIDWQVLAEQGDISFAFIKATEGSSYVDPRFEYNFSEARKTALRVGAYHFFSFESTGKTQAENFIKQVEKTPDMLPPVIDLEFYGGNGKNPPAKAAVRQELDEMLALLEAHYGAKPIIYVTEESYSLYIAGGYEDYDIWYRNVFSVSGPSDGRAWTFWQYTNRERLRGYDGEDPYIDMNVFSGSKSEFEKYGSAK